MKNHCYQVPIWRLLSGKCQIHHSLLDSDRFLVRVKRMRPRRSRRLKEQRRWWVGNWR